MKSWKINVRRIKEYIRTRIKYRFKQNDVRSYQEKRSCSKKYELHKNKSIRLKVRQTGNDMTAESKNNNT